MPNKSNSHRMEIGRYGDPTAAETAISLGLPTPTPAAATTQQYAASASGALREKLTEVYDLVPYEEITRSYVAVAEFGVKKYAAWNWSKGLPRVQLLSSLLRHTFAAIRGKEFDEESGCSHIDHILWNAAALAHNQFWGLEDGRRIEPHGDRIGTRGYKLP